MPRSPCRHLTLLFAACVGAALPLAAQGLQFPPRAQYRHSAHVIIGGGPQYGIPTELLLSNWIEQADPRDPKVRYTVWARAEWPGEQPPTHPGELQLSLVVSVVSQIPRADAERMVRPVTLAGTGVEVWVNDRQRIILDPGEPSLGWADPGPGRPTVEFTEAIRYGIAPGDLLAMARGTKLTIRFGTVAIEASRPEVFQALLDFASRTRPAR